MAKRSAKSDPDPAVGSGPGGVAIQPLEPTWDFLTSFQIWQGAPKSGKTSTAAALGPAAKKLGIPGIRPFFMLFERGSGGVRVEATSEQCPCKGNKRCPDCEGSGVRRKILSSLEEMQQWFEWVAKEPFNPIVIDTGDAMYQTISDGVCVQLGISNPTQSDHGIAWVNIFDEFREKMAILSAASKSIIVLMHIYYQEKRMRGGGVIQTATFNVSGKTRPVLAGMANQILHFEVVPGSEGDKFVISTRARAGVEAGDQWGVFPEELDRGKSPEEGAEAILRCFYDV